MPTIEVNISDLNRLLEEEYSLDELRKPFRNLGIEVEGETEEGDVKLEVLHNRPDLLSVEGIARVLKGHFGIEKGTPNYDLKEPEVKCKADSSLEGSRPVIVMGQIKNANYDDVSLEALMNLQEKLHGTLGRDREKISIGAYNLANIEPPIHYTTVSPGDEGFVPLEFNEKMTPQEILERHPKGQKYAHLIEENDRYPILKGSNGNVLSMPPIINSEPARLTENVSNIGVDVTGTDRELAERALDIIMASAAERGFEIRKIEVEGLESTFSSPEFKDSEWDFNLEDANEKLGISLDVDEACQIMEKMRYDVLEQNRDKIKVRAPFYRSDLLHEADLFEDLAVGVGYDSLEPELPSIEITGRPHEVEETSNMARRALEGLGFMEAMPYVLTSPERNFEMMDTDGDAVEIENPVSNEYSILRTWLLPGLMKVLRENKLHELPQKVFEVGDVIRLNEEAETGAENVKRASAVAIGDDLDYTYIRSVSESLMRELDMDWEIEPFDHPSFLKGRTAKIMVDGKKKGFFGEINPEVITNFELEHPVVAFELNLPV